MTELSDILFSVLIGVGVLLAFYLYVTKDYGYWKNKGVPQAPPSFLIGSSGWSMKTHQGKQEQEWCNKYGKVFGMYEGSKPVLMVADPDLIKSIFIKDFYSFADPRRFSLGNPILNKALSVATGERWKELRNTITPTFTSGKLRMMSKLLDDCCQILVDNIVEDAKKNKEIDFIKYSSTFTIDAIASCAFGIKLNSRKDPNNPFVTAARETVGPVPWRFIIGIFFPNFAKLIRLSLINPKSLQFFKDATEEIINKRKSSKDEEKPRDFLQLMLEAIDNRENKNYQFELDDIVSQCILFFIAGYMGTTMTIAYAVHQLAVSPDIQEKLIREIDEATERKKGKLDYDIVNGMKYLDAFMQEVFRRNSPIFRLERTCTQDYELGNTGILIEKGILVAVPVYALNHDPNYFPDPDKFDPERFMVEKDTVPLFTNMSFGIGPRNCIGMRFALIEMKMAIAKILQHCRIKPGVNTKDEIECDGGRGFLRPKNVFLKIELRM